MSVRSILGLEERGVGNSDGNNLTDDTAVKEEQEGLGIIDGLIGGRDEPAEVDETREFPRREWILLVLYARDASGERAPVRGDFTLSLALFLLRRNFEAYFDVTLPFEFESSELGPRDEESLSTLEQLRTEGLIDRRQSTDSDYPLDDHVYEMLSPIFAVFPFVLSILGVVVKHFADEKVYFESESQKRDPQRARGQ